MDNSKLHTEILVKLGKIETKSENIEDELKKINSRITSNQTGVNENRNTTTQILTHFSTILDQHKEQRIDAKDIKEDLKGLKESRDMLSGSLAFGKWLIGVFGLTSIVAVIKSFL